MALFGQMDDDSAEEAFTSLVNKCQIKRDPSNPSVLPSPISEYDILDPMTLTDLRTKAFELNVDFLKAAAFQISPLVAALLPEGQQHINENSPSQ